MQLLLHVRAYMARFFKVRQKQIFLFIVFIYGLYLINRLYRRCFRGGINSYYHDWAISDWMINFQAGFVRRGVIGELLFQAYQLHPFHLRNAILIIACAAFVFFVVMLLRMFRREGWSPVLLLAPCLLVITIPMRGLFWTRRDNIALLVAWGIFALYSRYIRRRRIACLLAATLLSALHLLIHEASFFFTFPIVAVFLLCHTAVRSGWMRAVAHTFVVLLPVLAVMGVTCVFKGNGDMAAAIWESWRPCMEAYPCGPSDGIGNGVGALAWNTAETFRFHFEANWLAANGLLPIGVSTLYKLVAAYYLVTQINVAPFVPPGSTFGDNGKLILSNIMLLQLLFLMPMFTVLSCDLPRIFAYWIFSSLIAYHVFKPDISLFPSRLTEFSTYLQKLLGGGRGKSAAWLQSPWIYILIMATM